MIDTATRPMDFAAARRAMIDSQLRTSGVNTPLVLSRMISVPREQYVPESARGFCYMDRSIPLGEGGILAQPVAHAKMLEEADLQPADTVLIVDNGSGYLTALVEPVVAKVESITPTDAAGSKKRGPYSLILIDGAIEASTPALAKRLAEDGRMVTGLIENGVTRLATGRRQGKEIAFLTVEDIALPRLAQFDAPKGWSF
ncbi:protein-L-isoaspartate O-methyltransferase family protein [Parerythrobacter jejuensis]|uniref:Protein-L-isoaspartate O-methyltransferase n=1 Tax=Parerythrobacter jejuensis TaxID=795812 RepID=A0A845ANF3_9SPHN|nr:protein-L-isoaspartate O-methyltransferase [Parerythrobacter jejuensis]MXP30967.1 protein-L-isoaspartate O-methyltransferase [Parerythrobacter jejuensis]MXP33727.1 protein-L-isoaspartate O-methyltransferase [Parerythrobacter jejuensis]